MKGANIGFVTDEGIILDVDNHKKATVRKLAQNLLINHDLKGYAIVQSSKKHYHLIFDRDKMTWKQITKIILSVRFALTWAIIQAQRGYLCIRVSERNGFKPRIVEEHGRTTNLISAYRLVLEQYGDI